MIGLSALVGNPDRRQAPFLESLPATPTSVDVRTLVRSPAVLVGSDGNCVATEGVVSQGLPHPRFYGTFPRVLGHYVRDLGLLPLERAVYKMTGGPANAL